MSRGGSRNRGMALANNTSGLPGIRFAWRPSRDGAWLYPYVVTGWYARGGAQVQRGYSVEKHGRAGALELAIRVRLRTGHIAPTIDTAMRALGRWLAS